MTIMKGWKLPFLLLDPEMRYLLSLATCYLRNCMLLDPVAILNKWLLLANNSEIDSLCIDFTIYNDTDRKSVV